MSDYNVSSVSENILRRVEVQVDNLSSTVQGIDIKVEFVKLELEALKNEFVTMMAEQQKAATIQQATTELVRVRQEIEKKFGNYDVVRRTMRGVLQATDVAIVRESTISRVSEELMISTPDYWLAPCLVAVSAWIGNNRPLAERAIAEAMKRDVKKTAITMALICRRNLRTDTCYEWLSVFFQSIIPEEFSESDFVYVNAYACGVFGKDEKHICDDYIAMWMEKITKYKGNFEEEQVSKWSNYCDIYKTDLTTRYPDLAGVDEFERINEYVGRLESVDRIASDFRNVSGQDVDVEQLRHTVDATLSDLIYKIEKEEFALRDEEIYNEDLKKHGNVVRANQLLQAIKKNREEKTMDFVEQMSNSVVNFRDHSCQKTALRFLGGFVQKGLDRYVDEKKSEFPTSISVSQNGWNGNMSSSTNIAELCNEYSEKMNADRDAEKAMIPTNGKKKFMIGGIAMLGLGVVLGFAVFPLFFALVALGVYFLVKMLKYDKELQSKYAEIDAKYETIKNDGEMVIRKLNSEWNEVLNYVDDFESNNKSRIA